MASGPITSWEIDEETVKTVSDFIWGLSLLLFPALCMLLFHSHLIHVLYENYKSIDICYNKFVINFIMLSLNWKNTEKPHC